MHENAKFYHFEKFCVCGTSVYRSCAIFWFNSSFLVFFKPGKILEGFFLAAKNHCFVRLEGKKQYNCFSGKTFPMPSLYVRSTSDQLGVGIKRGGGSR